MPIFDEKPQQLIDLKCVLGRLAVCRTTLDAMVKAGEFPRPVKVRGRVMWPEQAVDQWIAERFAEANNDHHRDVPRPRGRPRKAVLSSAGT